MRAETELARWGGVAGRAALVAATSRAAVDRALRAGLVVRDAHGRYALPTADQARRAANRLSGVVSFRSAAAAWGWEQKTPAALPDVTVPRKRRVPASARAGVELHRADLRPDERSGIVTSRSRTLADCLRFLPFDEALAVADSALRHRDVTPADLGALAAGLRGPGSAQARRVAGQADARAANPFESVLRAISLEVPGLRMVPQVPIRLRTRTIRPDLVDEALGVVAEADSFEWHGDRAALRRDCRRYNQLVLRGWRVLRFSWEDVMFEPAYVRACLRIAGRQAQAAGRRRPAA